MDNLILFINTLLLVILFSVFIYIIIKNNYLNNEVSNLEYIIFKPLFPFELKSDDPFKVSIYHRDLVNAETPYKNKFM
jgi:hypothetical protein